MRVPRSKRSSATLPCALVGERECVAGGWGWVQQALAGPGTQLDPPQVHLRVLDIHTSFLFPSSPGPGSGRKLE